MTEPKYESFKKRSRWYIRVRATGEIVSKPMSESMAVSNMESLNIGAKALADAGYPEGSKSLFIRGGQLVSPPA